MQSSMQYTIGTAISRAHEDGHHVDLLVEGHWLSGRVVGSDSMGVVLEDSATHYVVRLERVTAVRVQQDSSTHQGEEPEARPMPPRRGTLVVDVA